MTRPPYAEGGFAYSPFFSFIESWVIIKNKMDNSEFYDFENRRYIVPTLSRDEQLGFVDNLRNMVRDDTAKINTQTQRLGKNINPNLGGLAGSGGYFAQRYQTTPVEAQVKVLKSAAQSKALNDLMTNYQNQAVNRYNQAYRTYTKNNNNNTNDAVKSLLDLITNAGKETADITEGAEKGVAWNLETDANGNLYLALGNYANPTYGYERVPLTEIKDNSILWRLPSLNLKNRQTFTLDGKNYIYIDNGQDRQGWYQYGASQLVPAVGE